MYTFMLPVLVCSTSLLDNDVGVILIQHYVIYAMFVGSCGRNYVLSGRNWIFFKIYFCIFIIFSGNNILNSDIYLIYWCLLHIYNSNMRGCMVNYAYFTKSRFGIKITFGKKLPIQYRDGQGYLCKCHVWDLVTFYFLKLHSSNFIKRWS